MSSIEPVKRRNPTIPVSQGLALRVAIISGIAIAMFSVIFFRLWYLQVLTGEQYVAQANANRERDLPIAAPRGQILDRDGTPIVTSVTTNAVQIVPSALPEAGMIEAQIKTYKERLAPAETAREHTIEALHSFQETHAADPSSAGARAQLARLKAAAERPAAVAVPPLPGEASQTHRMFARLGRLLRIPAREIDEDVVRETSAVVYAPVTIKTDAGRGVLTEIGERANEYPGVIQQPVSIRRYPYGDLAAQVLGYVGSVSPKELASKAFRGVPEGTIVGQEGLEYYYDRYLRGKAGKERVEVNAEGYPVPSTLSPTQPEAGRSLRVTLDLGLQKEAEKALQEAKEHAQAGGKPAVAGAFVAMDPRTGEILAIGSQPTFNPNDFAKPLTEAEYKRLEGGGGEDAVAPLTDRAVNGEYPTGSTFKPITAMAALESGVLSPNELLGGGKCIQVNGQGREFCNSGMTDYGALPLVEALKVSSDTYFFEVGERTNRGPIIQDEARKLGVGVENHIDLPSEFEGVIPDAAWRQKQNEAQEKCEHEHRPRCEIVAEIKPWTIGENMNLAVGQGDLLTNPLQMAVAYSTLANAFTHDGEGWSPTPHLGMEIDETNGGLVQSLSFPSRHVKLNDTDLNLVMEGIHLAASASGGTSAAVWQGWNQTEDPVYGKTGTAQHTGKEDQAWYMAYVGNASRPIVIAVTVEQGGFGAETAAPAARLIASQYYGKAEKFVSGTSKTF